jgi:succinyl-CoA synthetase alpha subunit
MGSPRQKVEALRAAGVRVADVHHEVAKLVAEALAERVH